MNFSRPNITYTIGRLSRYTHNPDHDHWEALVRLMRYLRGILDFLLFYKGKIMLIGSPI